jgi:YD repeat-containing protein
MKHSTTVVGNSTVRPVGPIRVAVTLAATLGLYLAAGVAQGACFTPGIESSVSRGADAGERVEAGKLRSQKRFDNAVVEQVDPVDGETYSILHGEDGSITGWMEADGTTYDASGALVARIDSKGNVVAADGSIIFGADADCGAEAAVDGQKWAYDSSLGVARIYLNRSETKWLSTESTGLSTICIAVGGYISYRFGVKAGTAFGATCSAIQYTIGAIARYAVDNNYCVAFRVANGAPSYHRGTYCN